VINLKVARIYMCFKNSEFAHFLGPRKLALSSTWRTCKRNEVHVCNIVCIVRYLTVLRFSQVHQNKSIKGEITTNTGRRIVSEDNIGNSANFIDFHPCNYFRLAKLAFLKCFGLDSMSDNSLNSEQKKER
jgi:hypothetical protein